MGAIVLRQKDPEASQVQATSITTIAATTAITTAAAIATAATTAATLITTVITTAVKAICRTISMVTFTVTTIDLTGGRAVGVVNLTGGRAVGVVEGEELRRGAAAIVDGQTHQSLLQGSGRQVVVITGVLIVCGDNGCVDRM